MKEQDGSWKGSKHDEKYTRKVGTIGGARDRQGVDPGIGLTGADYKHVG